MDSPWWKVCFTSSYFTWTENLRLCLQGTFLQVDVLLPPKLSKHMEPKAAYDTYTDHCERPVLLTGVADLACKPQHRLERLANEV